MNGGADKIPAPESNALMQPEANDAIETGQKPNIFRSRRIIVLALGSSTIVLVTLLIVLAICLMRGSVTYGLKVIPSNNIKYEEGDLASAQAYVNEISNFLKRYSDRNNDENVIDCSNEHKPKENEVCRFSLDWFRECQSSNQYGYSSGSPCIFLELSLEKGTRPEAYQSLSELPADMPEDLKTEIEITSEEGKLQQAVWFHCNNIYVIEPWREFPLYYFENIMDINEGYLPPIIAVKLKEIKNQDVKIECNIWAKNMDPNEESNKVTFTVRVDE